MHIPLRSKDTLSLALERSSRLYGLPGKTTLILRTVERSVAHLALGGKGKAHMERMKTTDGMRLCTDPTPPSFLSSDPRLPEVV